MSMGSSSQRFDSLQLLRFLAAMLVAWTHARFSLSDSAREGVLPWGIQTMFGAIGVDLFFVISGVVIAHTVYKAQQRDSVFDLRGFCINRFSRVAPYYWLLAIPLVVRSFLSKDWLAISNTFLFFPIFDWVDFTSPSLSYGWSLSFEMYFYAATAMFLWLRGKVALNLSSKQIILIYLFLLIAFLPFQFSWFLIHFFLNPICLNFLAGICIYHSFRKIPYWLGVLMSLVAIFWMIGISVRYDYLAVYAKVLASNHLSWTRFLMWGVPSVLLVWGLMNLEVRTLWRIPKWVTVCGGASYSMYLIQAYSIPFVHKLSNVLGCTRGVSVALHFSVIFVGGLLAFRFVEKPLTRWSRNRLLNLLISKE